MHDPSNNGFPINADPRNESCACDTMRDFLATGKRAGHPIGLPLGQLMATPGVIEAMKCEITDEHYRVQYSDAGANYWLNSSETHDTLATAHAELIARAGLRTAFDWRIVRVLTTEEVVE